MKKFLLAFVAVLLVVTNANAQSKNRKENIRYNKDSVAIAWFALHTIDGKIIECQKISCKGKGEPIIYTPLSDPSKTLSLPRAKAWKAYAIGVYGQITGYNVYNIDYEAADQKKYTPQKNNQGYLIYIDEISGKRRPDIEKCRRYKISEVITF